MTLSPAETPRIWNDPADILTFVREQSVSLRKKFGELAMRQQLNPQEDTAITPPVMATYPALCASTYMPEFLNIRRAFALQKLELYWIFGINFQTPGQLFETLPQTQSLIIPLDRLPAIRASLGLKVLH